MASQSGVLAPGLQVTEKVRLISLLGRGGMGEVWLADHLAINTRVAVKFLDAELAEQDPSMLERFRAEASIAASLRSPHVVQIFDFGVLNGARPYIVMELLAGESLADRLDRGGPLSAREVGMVLRQAAEALGAAHTAGIVHRDIKPDNLFIIESGYELFIKVLDFGIAKQNGIANPKVVTGTWDVVGTPAYMSPEQLVSTKNVDHRTDLWALGIVAHELLTGDVPYMAETVTGFYDEILHKELSPLSSLIPNVSGALDDWMRRTLQRDPEDRFASAQEMADAFLSAVSGVAMPQAAAPTASQIAPQSMPNVPGAATHPPMSQRPARPLTQPAGSGVGPMIAPHPDPSRGADTVTGVASRVGRAPRSSGWLMVVAALVIMGTGGAWWWKSAQEPRPASVVSVAATTEPHASARAAPTADTEAAIPSSTPPSSASVAEHAPAMPPPTPSKPSLPKLVPSSKPSPAAPSLPPSAPAAVVEPPAPPPAKPSNCSGADAFILDASGNLQPRPECL